jgi:hypothetical protein
LTATNVQALAIDPSSSNTLYAVTDGGLVLRSIDSGGSWTEADTGLPIQPNVTALAIDPHTATTLYAGTERSGVFQSTDSGANWTAINTGLVAWDRIPLTPSVVALGIDPTTPSTLYAATAAGVFDIELTPPTPTVTGTPPTATPSPSPSPTPTMHCGGAPVCGGDCNGDGQVTVDEILRMVSIALGDMPIPVCLAGDSNGDCLIAIDEILQAVNDALTGCSGG